MRAVNNPTVFLVRHGKTEFNQDSDAESRLKGTKFDLPLTAEGHEEAKKAASVLADYPIADVKHSDMLRASQTARHISDAVGVESTKDTHFDPWDVGYLSGHTRADAERRIEYYINHPDKAVPEGEPYGDWHSEYEQGLTKEMKLSEGHPGKARVVVSHSCNAMATKAIVRGDDPQFYGEGGEKPGHITKLEKRGGQWQMSNMEIPDAVSV